MKSSLAVKLGIGILLLAVAGALLYEFWVITLNVVGGFLLYLLLEKCVDFLERRHITGAPAYLLLTLFFGAAILGAVLFVFMPLVQQLNGFADQLPFILEQVNKELVQWHSFIPFALPTYESMQAHVFASLAGIASHASTLVTSVATILIIALTLLASRNTLWNAIMEKIPNNYFEVTVSTTQRIVDDIQKYIVAKSAETVILVLLHTLGFWLIGFPAPLLFGLIGGLFNLIPYIGVAFTAVPVSIAAFATGGWPLVGVSMIVLAVIRAIDDAFLQNWLIEKFVHIHPLTTVIVVLIAGELMGAVGMVIAIPAYIIARITLTGMYDYLRSVQRHEQFLHDELPQDKSLKAPFV
jgi:predicted PurR-regulated permease PerM